MIDNHDSVEDFKKAEHVLRYCCVKDEEKAGIQANEAS
jgi:hypothetical protein